MRQAGPYNRITYDSIQSSILSANEVPREMLKSNINRFMLRNSKNTEEKQKKFFNSRDYDKALFTDEELPT